MVAIFSLNLMKQYISDNFKQVYKERPNATNIPTRKKYLATAITWQIDAISWCGPGAL